jgi:hypothetical protein
VVQTFTIVAKDLNGIQLTSADNLPTAAAFTVVISGPESTTGVVAVDPSNRAQFNVAYQVDSTGSGYTITIQARALVGSTYTGETRLLPPLYMSSLCLYCVFTMSYLFCHVHPCSGYPCWHYVLRVFTFK